MSTSLSSNNEMDSSPATAVGNSRIGSNDDVAPTTAVSLWFSKPQSKNNRRYGVVAGWAYKDSTKELRYMLWRDQGPAPYLSTLSAWISGLQPGVVFVSSAGGKQAINDDKNLNMWMDDVEEDLQQFRNKDEMLSTDHEESESKAPAENLLRVVSSVVPAQVNKDGVEILKSLVAHNRSALYHIQANPDLTTSGSAPATPLICAAAVLLEAMGLYQTTQGSCSGSTSVHPSIRELAADNLGHDPSIAREFSIQPMPATSFLVLDRAAASSLNVWPIAHAGQATLEGATSWHTSLYGLLAHFARTQMGRTQLQQWLLHPLIELQPLLERQGAVAYLVEHGIVRQSLVDQGLQLMAGTNLERLAHQLESFEPPTEDGREEAKSGKKKGSNGSTRKALQALYELYVLASQKVPALASQLAPILDKNANADRSHLTSVLLEQCATELGKTVSEIARAADLCEAVLDLDLAPREYVVKASHLPELSDLARELAVWQEELDRCHEDMNSAWLDFTGQSADSGSSRAVRLQIPDSKSNGDMSYDYQFRLPDTNHAKSLQEHKDFKGKITVHRILKSGVCFTNAELRKLASQKADLDREYDLHQRQVVANAMSVAASYAPVIQRVRKSVAFLDAVAAMAQLAVYSPTRYCRPSLTDSDDDGNGICLQGARHPCVERQENVDFIANDVGLTLGSKSCWLVTGPNMGGKSTFIRSVGAIVTLAQIGSYVPCDSAQINIVHSIAARVGAGDSQDRGISTFMAEMLEASAILQTATRRSLIIVDELGRGTSTFDGYGLARSICEYIVEKVQCLTIFATHFHELTAALPPQFPKGEVYNCHVSAATTDKDVVFLYKVEEGPCLESFGIQVAEMAQVPPQAILDAKAKLRELEATSSTGRSIHKRLHPDGNDHDDDDQLWLSKFQKLNVPSLNDDELRQALLQDVR